MDYAEQLLKGVDYVIAARLQEHKFDETIICTVVDDTKASEGLYVVSDGTIKFDAYSESVDYKVDQAVRVNIPKGDYSQKKYIVGKAVSEKNGNQPIVYRAPSAQILDLTDNVFSKGSGRSWSIYANGGQREKLIQSINLRDQYGGLIYDTLYLKANFKTIFNQYAMCSGGYGIYIIATMASKDSSGKQNQRIYYFDSKHMFGNPYNYLISSSQETKFFIGKDESITNIAIYLYQDNSFKYKDSKGTIQTYSKSSLAEDIIVSDIYISLGADLTQVEDNKVEIQTTESLNYNDPQTDVDNTKIIRLQWYNKDENNQYIGFSDGVVPHFEDRKFLFIGDSYGVGINSESWQGWPYYAAMNMDFTHPSSGGVYPPQSGATRYINADPDWSQWIAIAQSGVGFAATSRHNPKTEISGNEDNSDHDYNFAELVSKANSILHTAKGNGTEANNLPSLPAGVSQYSEVLDDVTDIVVAADGWSDMWYDKEGSDPPDNEDDSDPEDIALGIINLIRNAKARCSQKLKRIYIFGIGSCDDNYKIKNEQGEDISNTDYARNILNQTYSQYANIISKLNNCEPINIQKNDDGTYVTKTFTRRESGVLQILQNATSNNDYYDCPQIVFYDIHDILNSDDFKNDKSDNEYIREKDDGKHPSKSGYEKIGREIAKRTCLVESEMQYAKRLNEHNRIVRQMEKDGVPDDYAGFELSARYEEIKVLQKTLIKLINEDLFREIKYFRNAFNGVAKAEFEKWLSDLTGSNNSGLINNIIEEFNNLVKFYKDGLSFAKAAQDGLLSYSDSSGYLKEDGQIVVKPSGLRAIENQLLGRISQDDGGTVPPGYFTELIDGIGTSMDSIKKKITPETVNLGSIYDGYKVRIDKIKDTVIKNIATLKALICGNLYSIDADLDNTSGNDTMVNYYTSWYLFEDPAHKNDENGLGLLTHRIRHVQGSEGEPEKVNFIKTTYDPNKFDTKPNHYAISWYYYRNGYRAQEGEDNLGGNDWCAIEDPGIVNGKPRFTVFNTNDNIGLPTAERNETTNKLEYPKKPRIDDPNSYLSISFSKERPDIKQEKIKAILTYNHEKYESNIITFENKDPAAGPELTNGIQIVHGSNSQAVYPLYGVDNTLIRASDENTKRQLKVQYLNERGEPESGNETVLKGASIYWYVPTYATMLRTEVIDLESTSGDQENFVKSSKTDLNFTVTKETVTEAEKPYVNSCKLEYTIERPIFKQGNKDVYLFKGEIWSAKDEEDHLTDGGVVVKNNDKTKVSITYTYTYNRNDQYKKFYINNGNNIILLTNGGVTYSISEDGNYIIASDNTRYFINSSNKVTLPVNAIDDSDQSGYDCYYKRIEDVNDLTFTYRIKDYYSASFKNNTIKCKIIKGNQQLEGSISMDFNSYGSNGTNYSLIIKPVTWDVVWEQSSEDPDKKLLKNIYSFEIMLFDYENKQIPFNSTPVISIRSVKNESSTGVSSSPSASNEAGILSYLTDNIETFHISYAPQILQVTAKQPWPIDSDNLVTLEAYYPIPFKLQSGLLADIPTTIVYDSFGSNPSYYKNALCLYESGGSLKTDAQWSIQYYSKNGNLPNHIKSFLPQIQGSSQNGSAMLLPSNMYVSNCDDIQVVLRCASTKSPDQTWWLQPILLYQNRYPSTMLNNWDGGLSIDEDNNTILANIVGAGKKEDDNSFSGVLMGEVENADVPTDTTRNALQHPHTGLGLYGFHQGEQSFGFNVNGTAFIGKSGGGRIAFDGNRGIIHSTNWLYNKGTNTLRTQIFNNNKELMPGSQGMAIDLQNGHIDAYNFKLSSAGIQLNSDPPAGGDYIYIGQKQDDGADPDQFIKYTQTGDLIMRVNSLALTGTIGGQNLLNNTAPKEALHLPLGAPPGDHIVLDGWHSIPKTDDEGINGKNQRCRTRISRSNNGKSWIIMDNHLNDDGTEDQAQILRTLYQYIDPSDNADSVSNFSQGKYTLSGTIYSSASRKVVFRLGSWSSGKEIVNSTDILVNNGYAQFHYTFNITSNNVPKIFWINDQYNGALDDTINDIKANTAGTYFNHLKLEKGTVATPWNESDADGYALSVADQIDQDLVFNKLTNNGTVKGVFLSNNQLYINATYISTGILRSNNWEGTLKKADGTTVSLDQYDNLSQAEKQGIKSTSTQGTYMNLNTGELHIGQSGGSYIKYENGSLKIKVNEFSLTSGAIGGQNLLNNTAPKEALNLESDTQPTDKHISLWGWHTLQNDQQCKTNMARTLNGKSWITMGNTSTDQTLRTLYHYLNPQDNSESVEVFAPGKYTLSGTIYSNGPRTIVFRLGQWNTEHPEMMVSSSAFQVQEGNYVSFHYTFNITTDNVPQIFWINDAYNGGSNENKANLVTWFHHLKLEKGTVVTSWNESDIDYYHNSASNQLTQEIVFNKLTNNGTVKGVFLSNNQLYINATYINSGTLKVAKNNNTVFSANVDSGTVQMAGWSITSNSISKTIKKDSTEASPYYWIAMSAPTSYTNASSDAFLMIKHWEKKDGKENSTFPFIVRHSGKLEATNADISGKITATSGTIGGITISSNKLSGTGWSLNASGGTIGGITISSDKLSGTGWELTSTGGKIGGWSLSETGLTGTDTATNINKNGTFYFKNGTQYVGFRPQGQDTTATLVVNANLNIITGYSLTIGSTILTEDTLTKLKAIDYDKIVYQGKGFTVSTNHNESYNRSLIGHLSDIYNRIYALEPKQS